MFQFVVRRLRWLARIPLLPQLFDSQLLIWTTLFHRPRLRAMELLIQAMASHPGVHRTVHIMGGQGFARCGREFAHLHGNGLLDIELTRERATAVTAAQLAQAHHLFGPSAWVSIWLNRETDLDNALVVLNEAAALAAQYPDAKRSPPANVDSQS